jgi:hypothetical protein
LTRQTPDEVKKQRCKRPLVSQKFWMKYYKTFTDENELNLPAWIKPKSEDANENRLVQ